MINQLVNQRFEVLEKVGDSPLFTVYKARDKVANRIVAIKVVQSPYSRDAGFVEALQAAQNASVSLNHPNITRFQEFGIEEGSPYFVTEFVRGINLKERIRRIAPFTLSVAIDFACAIGEALHYAHSVGQIHGDLRAQNIIISPEGTVKVTDFGTQQAIARSPQAQREVLSRAAPYHAPELSTKQAGTVAGDVYALGALLYEMLTGTPLYSAETPEATAEQHALAAVPSPRAINSGVPRSIEGIVLKCLQKRPDERYRNAADLLNDLKSVRDALRFGKPLSWSPIDIEKMTAAPSSVGAGVPSASAIPVNVPVASRTAEPVADVAASSIALDMPSNNRLRAANERVSIYIKIAIGVVTTLIFVVLLSFVFIWSSYWVVPKSVTVPTMVGKPIDEVRDMAKTLGVRLIEHGEYTDKARDVVYKTDHDHDTQMRPGQTINIWYSKGAAYVDVPNTVNLPKDEATKKLTDAGLAVGKIMPEFSSTVATGSVIRQNVSYKKRVLHDTTVDLTISDGPKPEYATSDPSAGGADNGTGTNPDNQDTTGTGDAAAAANGDGAALPPPSDEPTHTFKRTIRIPTNDGMGIRQVRVEYSDSHGSHPPIIDELHNSGDTIPVEFDYYGKTITLRIFYEGALQKEVTFDPQQKKGVR